MKLYFRLLVTAFLAAAAWAQTKPDFSGTWKLDPARSRLNKIDEPADLVLKIEQHEPKLVIRTTMPGNASETNTTLDLTTDGAAHQQLIGGQPLTASARWDPWEGTRLIWQVQRETPEGTVTVARRAKLGDKGRTLTTVLTIKDKAGERKAYEFFVRQ